MRLSRAFFVPWFLPSIFLKSRLASITEVGIYQIVDNVVREGLIADPSNNEPSSQGVRKLLEYLKDDKGVDATTIATVGEKGYDGFLYAVVN